MKNLKYVWKQTEEFTAYRALQRELNTNLRKRKFEVRNMNSNVEQK